MSANPSSSTSSVAASSLLPSIPSSSPSPSVRISLPLGVSQSSIRLAALRAEETNRTISTPLIHDPFAEKLANGMIVENAPYICRTIGNLKRKRQQEDQQQKDETPVSSSSLSPPSPTPLPLPSSESSSSSSSLPSLAAAEVSSFNQSRLNSPDTMIRCRYFDDSINEFVHQHHIRQLVLLGAGMDTRAYRLESLASVDVFELDMAPVISYKSERLAHDRPIAKSLTRLAVDLGEMGQQPNVSKKSQIKAAKGKGLLAKVQSEQKHGQEERTPHADTDSSAPSSSSPLLIDGLLPPAWLTSLLASTRFNPSIPTLWVCEGLLMYLGVNQVGNLLGWITRMTQAKMKDVVGGTVDEMKETTPTPAACSSSSWSSSALPSTYTHYLLADIMNENTVRSKLRWYRFFRWGAPKSGSHPSAIEPFMKAYGWTIMKQIDGAPHIHTIGRDGLSYGRYLDPPLIDSTSYPHKPPMILESYIIRAQMITAV